MASTRLGSSSEKLVSVSSRQAVSHDSADIATIVPGSDDDDQRVVLLSSRSHRHHASDWEINRKTTDEEDIYCDQGNDVNGVESEDSGFQLDLVESTDNPTSAQPQQQVGLLLSITFYHFLSLSITFYHILEPLSPFFNLLGPSITFFLTF